jgi:GMP synthase-like glutamine amidotransferase
VSRVLAFLHVPFEHLGLIANALARHGVDCDYVDLYQSGSAPSLDQVEGVIFMGGPMSVNDDLPFLRAEERIILEAMARSLPMLGVCLGSQLIARTMGSRVYRTA